MSWLEGTWDTVGDFFDGVINSPSADEGAAISTVLIGAPITGALAGYAVDVIGEEIDYWAGEAGEAVTEKTDQADEWYDDLIADTAKLGFEGGDITGVVDSSTLSEYYFTLPGGVSSTDTVDNYWFTLGYNSELTLGLEQLSADVNLYLYDGYGTLIGSSTNYGNTNESITLNLGSGDYFVDVQTYDYQTSAYSLTVSSTSSDFIV